MSKTLFIADFFANQVLGGGELNDAVLLERLRQTLSVVDALPSHEVRLSDCEAYDNFIVSNFVNLSKKVKDHLQSKNYVIYEHDHKYLVGRNPGVYPNFEPPASDIINRQFYVKARAVFCQSNFHAAIVKANLGLDNVVSLGGNLWPEEHFEVMEEMCKYSRGSTTYAVIQSPVLHKNTSEAVQYCEALQLEYGLVLPQEPVSFLRDLGTYTTLVFLPKTPETLSRVVVEARMMGMATKTTNNIGAIHEEWFTKKGLDLIDYMRRRQEEIVEMVLLIIFEKGEG